MKKTPTEPQTLAKKPGEPWSPALETFARSMILDFDAWHDGIGYDLAALRQLEGAELARVQAVLISRKDQDWRDAEALAALDSVAARQALTDCLSSPNADVQLLAARHLSDQSETDERERVIVERLRNAGRDGGLVWALLLAEDYPTEAVKKALFWCARQGPDNTGVHAAALLFYLYGIAESSFDWEFRPFFLRFHSDNPADRQVAFLELCQRTKVSPEEAGV